MFVEKLQKMFDDSSPHAQRLINWCCVTNQECSKKTYYIIRKTIEDHNKRGFKQNYYGSRGGNRQLKEITDKDIAYLKSKIKELDGTLLVDITFEFMKTHKIFP